MYGSPPVSSRDLNQVGAPGFRESDRQQHMNSSLLRYRSAPSSLFGDACEDFIPVRPSSPETETIFARFLAAPNLRDKPVAPPPSAVVEPHSARFSSPQHPQQLLYPSQHPHHQMHTQIPIESVHMKSSGVAANLVRQSSSPAGLFAHLSSESGYGMMRGISGTGIPGATRLKGQISFSSRQSSLMSQISEMGSEGMGGSSPEGSSPRSGGGNARSSYIPGYQSGSWDETSLLSDSYSGLKRARAADGLNHTENHNGDLRSSSEMATIEKLLQFQDAVPCKIRAKRGCATHPRSIAERVRRTRISERMRKLQELVPNMDKQTNTADMLDLAVEHIKDLQKQVKTMSDDRPSCTCSSNRKKPYSNSGV